MKNTITNNDNETLLCNLADSEFTLGGKFDEIARNNGHCSGKSAANDLSLWSGTVAQALAAITPKGNTITATITENGNGLPSIGEICYDSSTDTVYTITAWDDSDRISTNGPGKGNSVDVILEERGDASDTTEEEWETIEGNNYGVSVAGESA